MKRMVASPWFSGVFYLSSMLWVSATWIIFYRLTDSAAGTLGLVGGQLLLVGLGHVKYRKALAANPAPVPS